MFIEFAGKIVNPNQIVLVEKRDLTGQTDANGAPLPDNFQVIIELQNKTSLSEDFRDIAKRDLAFDRVKSIIGYLSVRPL